MKVKIRPSTLRTILRGVAEAEVDLLLAVYDLVDSEVRLVRFEICNGQVEVGAVLEEDEGDVIGSYERGVHTDFRCQERRINFFEERGVDRGLAVLGAYDNEGLVIQVLRLELADDEAERVVDELDGGFQRGGEVQ